MLKNVLIRFTYMSGYQMFLTHVSVKVFTGHMYLTHVSTNFSTTSVSKKYLFRMHKYFHESNKCIHKIVFTGYIRVFTGHICRIYKSHTRLPQTRPRLW